MKFWKYLYNPDSDSWEIMSDQAFATRKDAEEIEAIFRLKQKIEDRIKLCKSDKAEWEEKKYELPILQQILKEAGL